MRFRRAYAALLPLACIACQAPDETPPDNVDELAARVSKHVEAKIAELGLTGDQGNYCFVKLNEDMDAHPDVDLKVDPQNRGRLAMIEGYDKTFMDKCLMGLAEGGKARIPKT